MKIYLILMSLFLLTITSCGGSNISSGKTLVKVNGSEITEGHLEFLANMNPAIARQLMSPVGKKQILDNLMEQELFYQAAKREGVHRDPMTQAKIDLYEKVILAQAYLEAEAEKDAKKYYQENSAEFERLQLGHILIRYATPEQLKATKKEKDAPKRNEKAALELANQIYERAQKGEKFEALAKEVSEDALSKESGGLLGDVSKNDPRLTRRGFQPLLEKAFGLKVGEIAGPIKTTAGYHLITVMSPLTQIPFEEVKGQLLFQKRREIKDQLLSQLKAKSNIVYAEEVKTLETPPATEVPAETQPSPPLEGHTHPPTQP